MKYSIYLFLTVLMFSCTSEKEPTSPEVLLGTWKNLDLKVTMKLKNGDSILEANQGEWEEILGIKPIVTTYNSDSTFKSEYLTLDDQLFYTSVGKWWIRNDSLVLLTEDGEYTYYFEVVNEKAFFKSNQDWNQDGKIDSYQGTQIRAE